MFSTSIELTGLVVYPAVPTDLGDTIRRALAQLKSKARTRSLVGWEEIDIPGRFIDTGVMKVIAEGRVLVADVTQLNFNVAFEIGYAIGFKKRVVLVRNEAIRSEPDLIREVGIFDTLGYVNYSDSITLASLIMDISDLTPLHFDDKATSNESPVYLVLPPNKGDVETHLIARIKKAKLFYRSFDPEELGRLSALDAIENVAASHGVVVPLLLSHYVKSKVHNLRAAFVSGLTMGMDKPLLLLQSGYDPVPLDYRDLVSSFKHPGQMDDFVNDFATAVTASIQSARPPVTAKPATFLELLTVGASSAENEYRVLGDYYLETDEFHSVKRGEVQVVLGRKGSGKTAIFFQLRDHLRQDKQVIVLDLKPEGFQLLKFKEQVLDFLEEGTREHTITAFWEYLLLLEICHKLLQNDRVIYLRNHELYEPYQQLSSTYASDQYIAEGDFAERMLRLTQHIAADFEQKHNGDGGKQRLMTDEITELIYKHDVAALRERLVSYLQNKKALWILFDNLDKGWPPHGIGPDDVLSLRCLLDSMAKLERAFRRQNIPTTGIIFIRNDVYEKLVEAMPDRGKISCAFMDWTDSALLLELLRRRFCSAIKGNPPFRDIWRQICVSHIHGEDSAQYMIDRCLMRPRSLIEFLRFCRSHAVNLGHKKIEIEDILQGEESYSTQLVNDINYEMRDVFPPAFNALYEFIECPTDLDEDSLKEIFYRISNDKKTQERILDLLLWYGVIGFRRQDGKPAFIYSVRYDIRRLSTLLKKRKLQGDVIYMINPAFWKGLEIQVPATHRQ